MTRNEPERLLVQGKRWMEARGTQEKRGNEAALYFCKYVVQAGYVRSSSSSRGGGGGSSSSMQIALVGWE